ncbi:hypothetical protein MK489_03320 [Myxococcota bacterium]|nr:hypothetical protein [Myxococcota bacterium]
MKPKAAPSSKRYGSSTLRHLLLFVVVLLVLKSFFHAPVSIVGSLLLTGLVSLLSRSLRVS